MNIILGSGITALTLLELKKDFLVLSNASPTNIGGQMNTRFQLGPRILHSSPEVVEFLKRVDISAEAQEFKVKYVLGDMFTEVLNEEQRNLYYAKTRGNYSATETCMNSSVDCFKGYDLAEIKLLDVLKNRNMENIINFQILGIDLELKRIWTTLGVCKYDNLVNTLDLEEFLDLVENPKIVERFKSNVVDNKKEVVFTLVGRKPDYNKLFTYEANSFIYFINSVEINRATFVNEEDIVLESNYKLDERWLNENGLFAKDVIRTKSQIIKELKLNVIHNAELVGRYAQYDHSVKLNNIIERFVYE